MSAELPAPSYSTDFDPETDRPVTIAPGLVRITAPNASAYTFTGTNSYVIGHDSVVIVDPGPDDSSHLDALLELVAGRTVMAVLLTHTHRDHSALVRRLMAATGAPLWSGGPHRLSRPLHRFERNPFRASGDFTLVPDRQLADGDVLELDGFVLDVVATPGHCANHLSFAIRDTDLLVVGDHVMGWNSTVVAAPDGDLGDYLNSLDKVMALPQNRYLPGHGDTIADGKAFARALRAHRLMRNGQLIDVVRQGALSLSAATKAVYPALTGGLAVGARSTLLSHAQYLEQRGDIGIRRGLFGVRLLPRLNRG